MCIYFFSKLNIEICEEYIVIVLSIFCIQTVLVLFTRAVILELLKSSFFFF
jgi:hypothetical protein